MSTLILPSNKSNIVIYKNSVNNSDNDKDSGGNSSSNCDGINENFIEGYNAKMTHIQDKPGKLVNHGTTTPYIFGLRPSDQFVPTSLYVKELVFDLKLDAATYIRFI